MTLTRRDMLQGTGSLPLLAVGSKAASGGDGIALPPTHLRKGDPERYWSQVRAQHFLLPDDLSYLHTGSLGVPPRSVIQAVECGLRRSAMMGFGAMNRWGAPIEQVNARTFSELRAALARSFGCDAQEIALTSNSTQGLSIIAEGLSLRRGDEVVITSLEHSANRVCWERLVRSQEIMLRTVPLTLEPQDRADVIAAFDRVITPHTRVVSFPAITTATGACLPVREIVVLARQRGALIVIDAAHMPGQVPLNLHDLDCDYLVASPHKWMFAPAGCGFLYGRGDGLDRLARNLQPGSAEGQAADRLMQTGTASGALFDGYAAALDFFLRLGPEAIFARQRQLRDLVMARASALPGAFLFTPAAPDRSAAMVAFRIDGADMRSFNDRFQAAGIRVAPGRGVRLSVHVHTRQTDIERFFDVLGRSLKDRGGKG